MTVTPQIEQQAIYHWKYGNHPELLELITTALGNADIYSVAEEYEQDGVTVVTIITAKKQEVADPRDIGWGITYEKPDSYNWCRGLLSSEPVPEYHMCHIIPKEEGEPEVRKVTSVTTIEGIVALALIDYNSTAEG